MWSFRNQHFNIYSAHYNIGPVVVVYKNENIMKETRKKERTFFLHNHQLVLYN